MNKKGNMMNKLLLILFAFTSLQVSAQTNEAREKLEQHVEAVNSVLPRSVQPGIVYMKSYISGDAVYDVNEIDENYVSLGVLASRQSLMKKTTLKSYKTNPALVSFAQMVVDCNMNVVIEYVSKQSGKSFFYTLTTKDLRKCIK